MTLIGGQQIEILNANLKKRKNEDEELEVCEYDEDEEQEEMVSSIAHIQDGEEMSEEFDKKGNLSNNMSFF